jgi:NhaP-type Na+/H+ and K+/H+ antiporter
LNKLPGYRRAPAGLEWKVLRRLPLIGVLGTLVPIVGALLASPLLGGAEGADARFATMVQIVLVSVLVLHWTVVFTVALLCVIVWIAKGPAYVADAYELPDAERPGRAPGPSPRR